MNSGVRGVDLNCDLGEGFGPYRIADDHALLGMITSANVACGFHAGDPVIMDATVRRALEQGADVGAHIGFADMQGFGRRRLSLSRKELETLTLYQLGALHAIAVGAGHRMTHVSFHGALGNMVAEDDELAMVLLGASRSFDPSLIVSSIPNGAAARAAERLNLPLATKFLADRAYDDQGLLVGRGTPGAVIKDPAAILERVKQALNDNSITTITGKRLPMRVDQILLHSDTPGSIELGKTILDAISQSGRPLMPISKIIHGK
ncbi:hypothetical protein CAL29_05775 [Bordetella genomosp. 10]|uniref:5-oxoprolinase (ATP-hydrolyzing) subunit A n=1 Tax=Bordetella genomosp. 10 TaxID=1416804 RepID=A0A261SL38_9BORD|nr:5-oxoprolinase subunit PxpA [Bordetella genomosp. 10]OZI37875.1 hypothetical protein CAL29_05775 [Bordetella genomosp. 10]